MVAVVEGAVEVEVDVDVVKGGIDVELDAGVVIGAVVTIRHWLTSVDEDDSDFSG